MNYYDTLADELVDRYESVQFEEVHRDVLDEFPGVAAQILDVGAGSGRDAAALADDGHQVVAVEPSDEMRRRARERHPHSNILWTDSRLPDLSEVYEIGDTYDVILLSAVWMHVRPEHRDRAMRKLAGLLEPGGKLVITSRSVPFDGKRTLYRVDRKRLRARGEDHGLESVRQVESDDLLGRSDVDWSTVVFEAPDDGTAALPTLRNIIVNDRKHSTYKFGLLRVFLRIAAEASGLVRRTEDREVEVPTGLVTLYWLRNYWGSSELGIPQMPGGGSTAVAEATKLAKHLSVYDLRVGTTFGSEAAQPLHTSLRAIRDSITNQGPVKHTTYTGTDRPIFSHSNAHTWKSVEDAQPETSDRLELTPSYLKSFGWIAVPGEIFETMKRHWVWIEPTVLREWTKKVRGFEDSRSRTLDEYNQAVQWSGADPYETKYAQQKLLELAEAGSPAARGVWSGQKLRAEDDFHMDHCIPYAHWHNNSLWNLLPSTSEANKSKSDRIPAADLLERSKNRIIRWWSEAYVGSEYHRRFVFEADASLPETDLDVDQPDLGAVFRALDWQVQRMRRDQQIEDWGGKAEG